MKLIEEVKMAPGIQEAIARCKVGISSQNIDASATIWWFFVAHHR